MNILVCGTERTSSRVETVLSGLGASIVSGLPEGAGPVLAETLDSVDLAIVDSTKPDHEAVCSHLGRSWRIPVVLLVDSPSPGWESLERMGTWGYLSSGWNNRTMSTHLKAIMRRLSGGEKPVEKAGEVADEGLADMRLQDGDRRMRDDPTDILRQGREPPDLKRQEGAWRIRDDPAVNLVKEVVKDSKAR